MDTENIICYPDGSIDWNANGWPEPNPGSETDDGEYTTDDMPNDIFDAWLAECDEMYDDNWSVDY